MIAAALIDLKKIMTETMYGEMFCLAVKGKKGLKMIYLYNQKQIDAAWCTLKGRTIVTASPGIASVQSKNDSNV